MRVGPAGSERPVVLSDDDRCFELSPLTADITGEFLEDSGIDRVREALAAGRLIECSIVGLRVGPPIAKPTAVVCIGLNYAAHAAEGGAEPPREPIVFFKHPNTVVGPDDVVVLPANADKVDWEVELAVVMAQRAEALASPEDALAHIAGYAIANDVSERHHQFRCSGGQWSKGKSFKTFNPMGPWLVPREDLPTGPLRLRSWVNGEIRQDSTTDDMIFSVGQLVYDLSQYLVLEPGDVINTGTPEGVAMSGRFPYLRDGDVVELEIEHLGRQRQLHKAKT
jgi:2-keto-4-pentenoate hydratase/2-oxohepta-3-ene-1,7-dioic acid hydratase in catechol pathway